MVEVKYVKYGIANRFKDCIEMNVNLRKYPELHDAILQHELSHEEGKWTLKDLKHDFLPENKLNNWQLIKFMVKNPSSFRQLLPIYYSWERGLVYDINLILMYLIIGGIFSAIVYWGLKII